MLKNNCTKLRVINILILPFLIFFMLIMGLALSKATDFGFTKMGKNIDVVINEEDFELGEKEVLAVSTDDLDFTVAAATPREKISSRASSARSSRGEDNNYISVDEVYVSLDMDLSETTGLSKEDFVELISNCRADTSGFFEENAELIYDLCQIYSINEIFFCGLISAESGWHIANNHRATYNYISLMVGGKLLQFDSVEDGLESAAIALHNNYLTPGGKFYRGSTLEGVRTIFCSENPGWTSLVYGRMRQII